LPHSRLEVVHDRLEELLGGHPGLLRTNEDCEVFRHLAAFDRLDADVLERLGETDHVGSTLYLNRFRGEPAISEFDWPFTSNHKSSQSIATDAGSVLQLVLPTLQPAHGQISRFRV